MANISISNLHVTGAELFADPESYIRELSNVDLFANGIRGGTGIIRPLTGGTMADSPFCMLYPL